MKESNVSKVKHKRVIISKRVALGYCPYCNSIVRLHNLSDVTTVHQKAITECICCNRQIDWS